MKTACSLMSVTYESVYDYNDAVSEFKRVTSSAPGTSEQSEAVPERKLVQREYVRETLIG